MDMLVLDRHAERLATVRGRNLVVQFGGAAALSPRSIRVPRPEDMRRKRH
jgi:hypothetical protein